MHKLMGEYLTEFDEVGFIGMWEMYISIFVKKKEKQFLKDVETNDLPLGIAKVCGNKGGLWLRFTLYERTFSVIDVHLTSGTNKADKRAEMMAEVLKSISKAKGNDKLPTDSFCDFNFIMGDMNWRTERTFSGCIDTVANSPNEIPKIDELRK